MKRENDNIFIIKINDHNTMKHYNQKLRDRCSQTYLPGVAALSVMALTVALEASGWCCIRLTVALEASGWCCIRLTVALEASGWCCIRLTVALEASGWCCQ